MTVDICEKCDKPKYPLASTDTRALGGICCCDKPRKAQSDVDLAKVLSTANVGLRAHKYGARPETCNQGHNHPSAKERRRCDELHLMEKAGEITDLRVQTVYVLQAMGGSVVGRYVADFDYDEFANGYKAHVTEDCKGMKTPIYKWKARHFEAQFRRKIRET